MESMACIWAAFDNRSIIGIYMPRTLAYIYIDIAKSVGLIKDPSTKNKYGFKLMTNEDRWMRIIIKGSTCEMLNFLQEMNATEK